MAPPQRHTTSSVKSFLFQKIDEIEFAQAIRLFHRLSPQAIPLGQGTDPDQEPVRLRSHLTFSVSSTELSSLTHGTPPLLTVNFLGILGLHGPLPTPYSEWIHDRLKAKDTAGYDFLNIFHHRLLSFAYRIREKNFPALQSTIPSQTLMGKTLLDVGGSIPYGADLPSLVPLGPLFWQRSPSLAGLRQLMKGVDPHLDLEEYQGQWGAPPPEDWSRLGVQHHQLGKSVILGKRCWDQMAGLRIILRRVSWGRYETLLSGRDPTLEDLQKIADLYAGSRLRLDFSVELSPRDIPSVFLGKNTRLGYTTWFPPTASGAGGPCVIVPLLKKSYPL